ncbi:MAG: M23 family metallopeptidase [Oscillospiraceae bacterium]|nr:M23 family metallopeptidase [Oscillospiraceae bacterium]MBQ4642582.1 M23 family metallopeptidase [Oscillospiraceae bacterium]
MKRWIFFALLVAVALSVPVSAEPIKWVDFAIPYESLQYAMQVDIETAEQEKHISWIDIFALAGCRTGGKCGLASVKKAVADLGGEKTPQQLLGDLYRYYDYYHTAYEAVLGGLLGNFAIEVNGEVKPVYGLKAFSPIAAGYSYRHCSDFGNQRNFGFARRHLGHDMMGALGTPIVAVEGGVVEAMGWNRYGGWRIGIRSFDSKRYYYYAHLQKDKPFLENLNVGDIVQPGDVIGFMGRSGYSDRENVNNIETVHLHFGMQLVFDESQKECNSEIWIDVYPIVRLLSQHRSSVERKEETWVRKYSFVDLDTENLVE